MIPVFILAALLVPSQGGDSEENVVIIIDEVTDLSESEGAPESEILILDDEAPAPTAPAIIEAGRTWLKMELSSRLMLDTKFQDTGEDVVEWWNIGKVRLDHRRSRSLAAVLEGRVRWGVTGEELGAGNDFLLLNARDKKWTGEVDLREAFVDWRFEALRIRVGQQIFVWGKNEIMAGADVLNPVDIRFDPPPVLTSFKDLKVSVFAFDVGYWRGDSGLQLVLLPFFTPNRGFLLGRDLALAPPGSPLEERLTSVGELHPSVEDQMQQSVSGTELPEESLLESSVALRAVTSLASIDLAATAYYGWDRTPRVRIDPDLMTLLDAAEELQADQQILLTDPELRNASLGVQQKNLAGEQLITARHRRMWRLALEAQGVLGDFVIRGDVGFSPGQTFYTEAFDPVWKNSLTAALGVEYMRGEEWYVALTGYGLGVFRAPQGALLLGVESEDVEPSDREIALLQGVHATGRWSPEDLDFELSGTVIYNVEPGDHVATASVSFDGWEGHLFTLGFMTSNGPSGTIGRSIKKSDFLYLNYKGTW